VFNLFQQDPAHFAVRISDAVELDESWIAERIEARAQAKRDRDFEQADAIRTELAEAGVEIEDSREGTRWSYK
jgi:cysteinyl-tRNA synthetase